MGGFCERGSGTLVRGGAGLTYTRPLKLRFAKASTRLESDALVRERGLARLDPEASRHRVISIGQLTLTLAR